MACDILITSNIADECANLQGGNEEFYPFNFVKDAFTVVDGVATAMNAALTVAYKYVSDSDTNTFTDILVADFKTKSSVVTQTLIYQLYKVQSTTSEDLTKMAQGKISGILKDNNGTYHFVGHENGFNVNRTVEAMTGGVRTDVNGYNVTLVAENKKYAPTLDAATVTAFLAIVTA